MPESSARETSYRWQPRAAKVAIVLLIAALTLSGCIFDRFFGSDAEPTPIAAEEDAPLQEDGTLPRLIERAMADLVQATDAAADEITVVSTEEVEWGDTGLGCPQPEAIYALVNHAGLFYRSGKRRQHLRLSQRNRPRRPAGAMHRGGRARR